MEVEAVPGDVPEGKRARLFWGQAIVVEGEAAPEGVQDGVQGVIVPRKQGVCVVEEAESSEAAAVPAVTQCVPGGFDAEVADGTEPLRCVHRVGPLVHLETPQPFRNQAPVLCVLVVQLRPYAFVVGLAPFRLSSDGTAVGARVGLQMGPWWASRCGRLLARP